MDNKIDFISGIYPKPTKVEWILSNTAIHIETMRKELDRLEQFANDKGYVNWCLCQSKNGKQYYKRDDYKPKEEVKAADHNPDREDLPF